VPLAADLSILPMPQRSLWPELGHVPREFVLYGGTAVALRFAHRISVDFDFFSSAPFEPFDLRGSLGPLAAGQILQSRPNTLTLLLDRQGEVKLSLFGGITGRVGIPEETADGAIRVASPLDLLGHKLKVILQRAEARDYLDIAALIRSGVPLEQGIGAAATLFAPGFPVAECAKALAYFKDIAEPWRLGPRDRDLLIAAVKGLQQEIPVVPLASRELQ
jgi:hypothetical protein